jgi:hypothetical protein
MVWSVLYCIVLCRSVLYYCSAIHWYAVLLHYTLCCTTTLYIVLHYAECGVALFCTVLYCFVSHHSDRAVLHSTAPYTPLCTYYLCHIELYCAVMYLIVQYSTVLFCSVPNGCIFWWCVALMLCHILTLQYIGWVVLNTSWPMAPYFNIIWLCLIPDNFTFQGEGIVNQLKQSPQTVLCCTELLCVINSAVLHCATVTWTMGNCAALSFGVLYFQEYCTVCKIVVYFVVL